MTLKQLQVFLAIAREQNFSSAARRINLSQPTLSEHVAELERELGTRLFARRRGGRTSPTEAGRVFEAYAARVISTVADGRRAIEEIDGLKRGSLIIGVSLHPPGWRNSRCSSARKGRPPVGSWSGRSSRPVSRRELGWNSGTPRRSSRASSRGWASHSSRPMPSAESSPHGGCTLCA